jgi:hypothetical protein
MSCLISRFLDNIRAMSGIPLRAGVCAAAMQEESDVCVKRFECRHRAFPHYTETLDCPRSRLLDNKQT